MTANSSDSATQNVSECGQDDGRTLWVEQDDPSDTGVPLDQEYCAAHEEEATVSVGYSADVKTCTASGQPLVADGGDGSGTGADAFIDEHAKQHTSANEASAITGSTFNAAHRMNPERKNPSWSVEKWDRLFLYHSGKDSHKRGDGANINPRHKENTTARFNHERAEVLCDRVRLSPRQKHAVLEAVGRMNFSRFTYLCAKADDGVGAVEVATVGIIACVVAFWTNVPLEHPSVEEAAQVVGVSDVQYVAREVADKAEFPWLSASAFEGGGGE